MLQVRGISVRIQRSALTYLINASALAAFESQSVERRDHGAIESHFKWHFVARDLCHLPEHVDLIIRACHCRHRLCNANILECKIFVGARQASRLITLRLLVLA